MWLIIRSAYNKKSFNESGTHSHGKYTLTLYMCSDNPLCFDGMCIICIEVGHGESCAESIQCEDLVQAECLLNTCQCRSGFNYNGERFVGNSGMYNVHISNVVYSVIFSAGIIMLISLTVWCRNYFLKF